ncbi:unnamed protein product [Laminaria digitata]
MKASIDNLIRLGRLEEADKVRKKLEPLEKGFWAKALAENGFREQTRTEKDKLLGAQQAELGSLSQALRRETERARKARDAELKAQRRKNHCSSDDVWSLWSAAKSGEVDRLSRMLSLPGVDADAPDPDSGWTALHFASRQGKLEAVEVLIEWNAFIGARGPDGRTPLHLAAGWGTYEVCFSLLQAGADKNVCDRSGETPQHLAESRRREKIVASLERWRPLGLTATQTQKIKMSREEGSMRPWETEADPAIRAQLRALDMKRATFGEKHTGTRITLGKLGGLCRAAGRLEDAKQHLERLVELLQDPVAKDPRRTPLNVTVRSDPTAPPGNCGAQAVALGNLGVVCRELGDAEGASRMMEASLEAALSAAGASASGDTNPRHLVDAATRNLGLHYLAEGRVADARPLLRACLETYEETLRSDMLGGNESVDLIPPLTLLSYADMLAGDHVAAADNAERARTIADKNQQHSDALRLTSPIVALNVTSEDLSDPIPRLEWMGVQRFTAGDHSSASKFFTRARKLVLQRLKDHHQECSCKEKGASPAAEDEACDSRGRAGDGGRCAPPTAAHPVRSEVGQAIDRSLALASNVGGKPDEDDAATGEFHPEAMRLDRCMAVAVCRRGPAAF